MGPADTTDLGHSLADDIPTYAFPPPAQSDDEFCKEWVVIRRVALRDFTALLIFIPFCPLYFLMRFRFPLAVPCFSFTDFTPLPIHVDYISFPFLFLFPPGGPLGCGNALIRF